MPQVATNWGTAALCHQPPQGLCKYLYPATIRSDTVNIDEKRSVLIVCCMLALSVMPACFAGEGDAPFEALGRDYVDRLAALSPVSATVMGDHRFDAQLDDVDDAARAKKAAFCREIIAKLDAIDPATLSRANQVDYALLKHELRGKLWRQETLEEWAWNPLAYTSLSGNAVYGLLARDFAPLEERLGHVADRLEQFPRLFRQVRSTLQPDRVPKIHAETAVKQNRGVLNILDNMVKPHLGKLPPEARQRLSAAMAKAGRAVELHQEWLELELLPKADADFRIGAEMYDAKLAFSLHGSLTRHQVRQRADKQLRDVRNEMYKISQGLYEEQYPQTRFPTRPTNEYKQAIIRACLEMAYAQAPKRDEIVETAKRSLTLATDFIRREDLITIPPDPLEIIVMPEFQRGVSLAYCDSPGALEVGEKTFYAVAPPPADWTPQQVESLLREYNVRSLHNLTIHEAMPGHFLQLAHSNRYPGKLRAVLSSGVFIEGWAVYSELMMCDEGFLDDDPLMRLIVLKWYLRDTTNAIIDQAIHAGDMTRAETMVLLTEGAFQEEREAAAKWVRAQLTSAQLSTYFVGYLEHVALRREMEEASGEEFRLKEYHDRVLSFGSPPVKYVRALMLEEEIPR